MKRIINLLLLLLLTGYQLTKANPASPTANRIEGMQWTDGDKLPLLGRGIAPGAAANRYQRLPDSLKATCAREFLWFLGTNSAGEALRFATDAPRIAVRWTNLHKCNLPNMSPTGVRGLDLYMLMPDSIWRYVGSAVPDPDYKQAETFAVQHMEPGVKREFLLHLSLYDGVENLSIGVDNGYSVDAPSATLSETDRPVVCYGTSIMQGCSASRPGMAFTNIMRRRLGRDVINFGFSGNGQLDAEIAPVVAGVENPSVFVLDFCPNVSGQLINERFDLFYNTIRERHPDVPILLVENAPFPGVVVDQEVQRYLPDRNQVLRAKYEALVAAGDRNVHYLTGDNLIGLDGEATVDGIHYTDTGMTRYADILIPAVQNLIK